MTREIISNGYKDIKIKLNSMTLNIAKLIWDAYKMTWYDLQDIEYDKNNKVIRDACLDVINNRALPTPKESIKFNFEIRNLSRVCLAQITRGRIGWWYNVESQMPLYLNHGITIPKNLYESKYKDEIIELINLSQSLYDKLATRGYPPQDLRYICLHGQKTSMVVDCNYQALPGFYAMRCENGLTDELNYIARLMLRKIKNRIDLAIYKEEIDSLDYELWQILINNLDCLGAKQKKCLIHDKVFGNTGRFESGHDKVASPKSKIKPDFDFRKSAWYLELQDLDEDLLFDGEKEMIERWKSGGDLVK